jgi:hypothetical protein
VNKKEMIRFKNSFELAEKAAYSLIGTESKTVNEDAALHGCVMMCMMRMFQLGWEKENVAEIIDASWQQYILKSAEKGVDSTE